MVLEHLDTYIRLNPECQRRAEGDLVPAPDVGGGVPAAHPVRGGEVPAAHNIGGTGGNRTCSDVGGGEVPAKGLKKILHKCKGLLCGCF